METLGEKVKRLEEEKKELLEALKMICSNNMPYNMLELVEKLIKKHEK